jgi:signal transduction histidine kinase
MGKPSRWTLTTRITLLTGSVALLLTVVAVGAAMTAHTNNQQVHTVFDEIAPLRTASEEMPVAVLNQETGVRGYALDGDPSGLVPYTDGLASQQSLTADITSRVTPGSLVAADLRDVTARMDAWRAAVADPVIAKVRAGDEPGARALLDTGSKIQFDGVRQSVDTLQSDVLASRNTAVNKLQQSSSQIAWELIAAAIIVVIGGVLLAYLLRRLVTAPVDKLAASVRIVAGGDYNAIIDTSGPPELAKLGQDVDDMRQRIVSDLRIVERASESVAAANATLERHTAELTRSNEDLEQFAYVASHDLQEPLRKVASFVQLLQRRYAGQLDERADQYIAFAVDGAHRMQRLINDLLKFSRIGRVTSEFADVDLNSVIASVAAATRTTVDATGGSITWTGLPVVRGDESLLVALFTNLVGNSVKFRRPGEPIRIEITARPLDGEWELSCVDNGIGIEPEYVDKIFVIFQRLHSREAYPGTGIGLAIAKRIVDYHGGRIWADTQVTSGAAIRLTLPVPAEATSDVESVSPVAMPSAIG